MNKILLFVILAIISLGLFLVGNLGVHRNPFNAYTSLDYPQFTIADDDDNIYVIDTSLRRVLVADSNGTLLTSIQGGDRTEGAFYYARSITPGTDGKFFVLNYVLDTNGMFLLREELIEYDLKGNFQRIFYQRIYETRKSTLVQRGELFSPVVMDDRLYFFLINDQQIRLVRKSLQNEVTELLGTVPYDDAIAYVADIEWLSPEFFLILDKRGFFVKGDIYGNYQTLRYQAEDVRATATVTEVNNSGIDFLPTEYFWDMSISGDGNIYITDLINRQIVFFPFSALFSSVLDDAVITYSTALDQSLLTASGFSDEPFIYYVNGSARNGFLATYDYGLYYANAEEVIGEHIAFKIPAPQITLAVIRWAGIILGALILVALLLYLFVQIFTGRLSLIAKQVLITVPLLGGGVFIIANVLLGRFISQYEESSIDKMLSLAQTISTSINGDHFYGIQSLGDYMNDDYRNIREQLQSALNYNQNSWNEGLYFALYQVIDETLYGFMYLNNGIGLRHPFTWYGDPQSVYRTAFEGTIVFEQAEDISGNFLYAIAPIYDSQGRPVALLEIGSDLYSFSQNAQRIYNQSLLYMSLISVVFIIAIILMTFAILHGLRILRKGVERIADGDWAYRIELNSNDEVSELGRRFNYMSDSINKQLNHIELLNNSYKKFFPDAFLQHLDLKSVTEVKLGDQVEKTMSVLFSDIRAFTTISEKLSPEQNFGFLNNYLKFVAPIIRDNNGFIDKYIGDAIMALFPSSPTDASRTAVAMISGVQQFNHEQAKNDLPEIKIGIGIHTGPVMLGIIGEQERMEATVIADSVNFASRLESLSKQMGASIIISEDTLKQLSVQDHFIRRYLGRIQVVGKHDAVGVYELLNGLPEAELEGKLKHKSTLQEGIHLFEVGDMKTALSCFTSIQADPFNEKIASMYLLCIEEYYSQLELAAKRNSPPASWDGILKPVSK